MEVDFDDLDEINPPLSWPDSFLVFWRKTALDVCEFVEGLFPDLGREPDRFFGWLGKSIIELRGGGALTLLSAFFVLIGYGVYSSLYPIDSSKVIEV